jgi:O-antigen ligase
MALTSAQDHIARSIAFGGFFTTIFVSAWWTVEPVNAPKMLALAMTAGACLAAMVAGRLKPFRENKLVVSSVGAFVVIAILTLFSSSDSLEINLFGVGGRNTGLITYISLAIVFIGSLQLQSLLAIQKAIKAFAFAGIFNVVYCLLSIAGIELIPWNNIYNTILGTLGNPNFIGAFLGMFGVLILASILDKNRPRKFQIFGFLILCLTFFEILKSHAIQGIVVFVLGALIALWMKIRSSFSQSFVEYLFLSGALVFGTFAVLGALQIGPLTKYIYKASVSLRGEYWQAAWNMGIQHPFTGVGMDSYGSWFRRARDTKGFLEPGSNVTTNAAHNVFLDIFAYGGFPLLIAYILIIAVIARSAFNLLFASKNYDFVGVGLVAVWVCYQAQALISINQIGVAIWGWIFGGLILAYDKILKLNRLETMTGSNKEKGKNTKVIRSSEAGISLASFVGVVIALIIAMPPMVADAKWRNAMGSGDAKKLEEAATSWPQEPVRLNEAIKIFSDNKLDETALKLSKISTTKFSEYYISWYSYIQLMNITDSERAHARTQLHRLDPNNPEFKP